MRDLSMLLVLAAGLWAQNPAGPPAAGQPVAPETAKEDLCTLEGRITHAQTGEAINKVRVQVNRVDSGPVAGPTNSYTTTTDATGKFAMKDLEPGQYRVSVSRAGFLSMQYGARAPGRPGGMLTLSKGQHMKDADFRLWPQGVVSGRILDEDGEAPPELISVEMLRMTYRNGRKTLSTFASNYTDDRGEFRINSVPPGKYYLRAMPYYNSGMNQLDRSASERPEENYIPVFYPGTPDATGAVLVEMKAGSDIGGISMKLAKARTFHVKGRALQGFTAGSAPISVSLSPRTSDGSTTSQMRLITGGVRADAKGNFEIASVTPGSYVVRAQVIVAGKSRSGSTLVNVTNQNVENVQVAIGAGLDVVGQVVVEGQNNQPLDNLMARLTAADAGVGGVIMAAQMSTSRLDENLKFKMEAVNPDKYDFNISPLPAGFYIKSVRAERTDVLLSGLDLTNGAPPALTVVLSANAGQLTGAAQNPDTQKGAAAVTVVLAPQEKERREVMAFYKTANTDQNGSFTIRGITPGEYKIYAWEDLEPGAYMDPDVMKPVESKGVSVTIKEGSSENVMVNMIPADSPAAVNGQAGKL